MELTALGINNTTNIVQPLEMRWQPKEDITTYELAKCLPYLLRQYNTMPYEINKLENHFRHFEIIDHNDKFPKVANEESDLVPYHTLCIPCKNGDMCGCSIANKMVKKL
jgi:hypothetical protein